MNIRILQIQIEADIGDMLLQSVVREALTEYFATPDLGSKQTEVFTTSKGVKITTNHFYRYKISE